MGWRARPAAVSIALGATAIACAQIAGEHTPDDAANVDPSAMQVTPDSLDLGNAPCGTDVMAQTPITLDNTSDTEVPYSITIAAGSPLSVHDPAEAGTVPPHSQVAVNLVAKTNDVGATTTDVTIKLGPVVKSIPAKANGTGPKLVIVPSTADFGDVRRQNGGTVDVELRNVGTDSLPLTRFDGAASGLSMTWGGATTPLLIAAGTKAAGTVTLGPGNAGAASATFKPIVDGAVCGALPTLPAKANLIDTQVTVSVADFGSQECSSAPPDTKDIVISNYSTEVISASAALQPSSAFALAGASSATIGAGNATTPTTGAITLKLNPIGAVTGTVTENVAVTVSGIAPPDGGSRMTTARVDIHGAILTYQPNPLTGFSSSCFLTGGGYSCTQDQKSFTITNTGSDTVQVEGTLTRTAGPRAWAVSASGVLSPGANPAAMFFSPDSPCTLCEIKLDLSQISGAKLCTPPPTMDFQGSTN